MKTKLRNDLRKLSSLCKRRKKSGRGRGRGRRQKGRRKGIIRHQKWKREPTVSEHETGQRAEFTAAPPLGSIISLGTEV